jgi:type VI secretion system protein ImpB
MPLRADQKPGAGSSQNPRLTYDIYTTKGVQQRELPFVLGILADFLGHRPAEPNRRFVTVDRHNIDAVLSALQPELRLKVPNRLADDDTQLACELKFHTRQDFSPDAVAGQFHPLKKLLELRASLAALRAQLHNNEKLEELLRDLLSHPDRLQKVKDQEGL